MDAHSRAGAHARRRPAVVAVLSLVVAACSGTGSPPAFTIGPTAPSMAPSPSASAAASASPASASPAPSASAAAFPVTVTDDEGTAVTIDEEPDSIVSLTPGATETLFALGVGDAIKGKAEDIFLYPPEAGDVPDVAKFGEVDVEKIVGLEPDVVIAGGDGFTPVDSIAQLRSLDVPVVVVDPADVATVFHDIELLGKAVGRSDEAETMTTTMRAEMDRIGDAVASQEKPKVFYETGTDDSGKVYGIADGSFMNEMIQLAGAVPVTTGSPDKYDMSTEKLIADDPELILLGDGAFGMTPELVAARPGWKVISAVKSGDIRPIDDQTITRPGPRLFLGLALLASTIHPDAAVPSPSPLPSVP